MVNTLTTEILIFFVLQNPDIFTHFVRVLIRKSIVGKAKSVIRNLGPIYTMEDVTDNLTREYEGVASSVTLYLWNFTN